MKHPAYAGGRPADFAHLMGAPVGKPRSEKDDDDKAAKARKARRAAEDKRRAEEDQKRKDEDAKRAEEDNLDPGDMPENDDPDEDQDPDCPECHGSGEDDDGTTCDVCGGDGKVHVDDQPQDVDDMDGAEEAKGAKAERARWTKVLGHKACAGKVAAACAMLANGNMSANAIISTLKVLPGQASNSGLRERMAAERPRNPGPDAAGKNLTEEQAFAAEVKAAAAKARGERA
jgi:hypothetical protein